MNDMLFRGTPIIGNEADWYTPPNDECLLEPIEKINPQVETYKNTSIISPSMSDESQSNKEPSIRVVVARHQESLEWLPLIPEDYEIYVSNSGDDAPYIPEAVSGRVKVVKVPNGGREAGHWLRYIVNNYDNLADIHIFLQGAPHIGHTTDILLGSYLELDYVKRRVSVSKGFSYILDQSEKRVPTGGDHAQMAICYAHGRKYLPLPPALSGSDWGGQHFVTRGVIRGRPIEFYKGLIDYGCSPEQVSVEHPSAPLRTRFGWVMERTYNVLYGVWPD